MSCDELAPMPEEIPTNSLKEESRDTRGEWLEDVLTNLHVIPSR